MKKQFLMILAAGTLAFTSCREDAGTSTETNENDSETPDNASGGTDSTSASNFNFEQESRQRANRISSRISQDLNLDTATQARIRTVMYNRARQVDELEMRFSSTNLSGGLASDSGSMMSEDMSTENGMMMDSGVAVQGNMQVTGFPEDYPTQYYENLESIDSNVDLELKGFLTPTQFKTYQTNRNKYLELDSKLNAQGESKLKIDKEEAKFKSGDTKVKTEGDESKLKTDTEKIKRENGEVKYKSGDTKIKLEN